MSQMKLLTDYVDSSEVIKEEVDGKKEWYIQGVYLQEAVQNKNKRVYPAGLLEREVAKYTKDFVNTNRALGELNHPQSPTVNPERASHRVLELTQEGHNFIGKALVLNTPMGNIVKGLLEGGTRIGVSSRGIGSVKQVDGVNEVQSDFELKCIDIVSNPSAPSAFVDGIMEGVEYFYQNGVLQEKTIEEIKEEIRNTKSKDLNEAKINLFKRIMGSLNP